MLVCHELYCQGLFEYLQADLLNPYEIRMTFEIGQKIGEWTVLEEPQRKSTGFSVLCECVCGQQKWVELGSLKKGVSKSCGCQSRRNKSPGRPAGSDEPTAEAELLLALIAKQELLPADQFTLADGVPTWTLNSFALMLGTDPDSLIAYIIKNGNART